LSQIYKAVTSGSLPPTVPTTFVTDINSPAVPAVNILDVFGNDTTINNINGIQTDGSSGSNILTIQLTNRLQGSGSTSGAVTTDLVTFALDSTPATYVVEANFSAFESTTPSGAGYSLFGTVRTTGIAASLVGTPDKINNEDAALVAANADFVVSGNNLILRVTGVVGLNINWSIVGYYVKVV
jgi:hypothetical protein